MSSCVGCPRADEFGICAAYDYLWETYCSVCCRLTDDDMDPDLYKYWYDEDKARYGKED